MSEPEEDPAEPDRRPERARMVAVQIAGRGVRDERLLAAMREVPRERFLPPRLAGRAYDDAALAIGLGQTISQPYTVAWMLEAARIRPEARVLEIGAGSGYAAAVLSRLAREVFAIERHETLFAAAEQRLAALGCGNVHLRCGDGSLGWPEAAPFDAIVVSASGPCVPEALQRQLAIGGRLVIPAGPGPREQQLLVVERCAEERWLRRSLGRVQFVPLVGRGGWPESDGGDRRKSPLG
jgi:protein-L-isoaspartate(D-aspartate) O-methyltransferase